MTKADEIDQVIPVSFIRHIQPREVELVNLVKFLY
jgi:hypothetical protein